MSQEEMEMFRRRYPQMILLEPRQWKVYSKRVGWVARIAIMMGIGNPYLLVQDYSYSGDDIAMAVLDPSIIESGYHIYPQDLFHGHGLGMTLLLTWSKKRINADPTKAMVLEDRFAEAGRHRELKHYKLGIDEVTKVAEGNLS